MSNATNWQEIRPLGSGGFGETTLVERAGDRYVLKRLLPRASRQLETETEALFTQEAEHLRTLGNHSQIPALIDVGVDEAGSWLRQEYIPGENLEQMLESQGVWSEATVIGLLRSLLPVLQTLRNQNVIHRDIKPANIIWWNERYYLVDFGVSKLLSEAELHRTGTMIGSAVYAAPEQTLGKATFASDIYSLGVTCIHLLTGILPFDLVDTGTGHFVWRDYLTTPVSTGLGQLIDRMLEKGTHQRYRSAGEVLIDLEKLNSQASVHSELANHIPGISAAPRWQSLKLRVRQWRFVILLGVPMIVFGISYWGQQLLIKRHWQTLEAQKELYHSDDRNTALERLNEAKQPLNNIDLSNRSLVRVSLPEANLQGANLSGSDLTDSYLGGANLARANLQKAYMGNSNTYYNGTSMYKINFADANLSQVRMQNIGFDSSDFSRANLTESNFDSATFQNAKFLHTNLTGAQLANAKMKSANLSHADLTGVNLNAAELANAIIQFANFQDAQLIQANFDSADLQGTDFSKAQLKESSFWKANLKDAVIQPEQLKTIILCETILPNGEMSDRDCKTYLPKDQPN
jgi:serine/threonine protein kinase